MVANNRIKEIETKLQAALFPSYLEVIDESEHHVGHAGYQGGGHHFAITISSEMLTRLTRVQAHRLIYSVLSELMISEIHALRITILADE